ncbi:MAG: MFS transporter, partial [Nitriliruptoraceae bacterium]
MDQGADRSGAEGARPRPQPATGAVLLAASTLTVMAPTIVAPALPAIAREFDGLAGVDVLVPLVLTLPALVIALTASGVGYLVDRIGRRPVLLTGIAVYGAAGGTGLVVASLPGLLAGRVGLGLAVAAVLTAVTTLIGDLYHGGDRDRMLARQAAVMGASGTVFTVLSGLLAGIGWRWSFALYPAAWVLLPAVVRLLPAPPRSATRPLRRAVDDVVPGPGTVSTTTRHEVEEPTHTGRRGGPVVVAVSIALLAAVQVVFYLLPVQLPFLLEETFGLPASRAGLLIALPPLAYASASLVAARVASGHRRASVVALAFTVTAAGYLAVGTATSLVAVVPGLIVGGAGLGLIVPNLVAWVAQAASPAARGRLMGLMTSALFLGQFVSPLLWAPVVRSAGRQAGLTLSAATLVVFAFTALVLDRGRRLLEDRGE